MWSLALRNLAPECFSRAQDDILGIRCHPTPLPPVDHTPKRKGVEMMRSRAGEILMVMVVAAFAAGCSVAGATGGPGSPAASQAASEPATATASPSSTPELSVPPTPAQSPSMSDAAWVDWAQTIVRALGGSTPAGATASVSSSGSATQPRTKVTIGDWTLEWNAAGSVVSVVVVPSHPAPNQGVPISEAAARLKAGGYLSDLGFTLGTPDVFAPDPEMAWLAQWYRRIDGVPAPRDGWRMTLAPNGTFLSSTYSETPAASAPAKTISQAEALARFPMCKSGTGGPNGKVETCTAALEWFAKTDGVPQRLCWRMDYRWHDNAGGSAHSAMWVDAGTGETVDTAATM